jgi:hypothetical protein
MGTYFIDVSLVYALSSLMAKEVIDELIDGRLIDMEATPWTSLHVGMLDKITMDGVHVFRDRLA